MPVVDVAGTGRNIRRLQKQHGTNGKMLAEACGVTAAAVCRWGKECMPSIDNLIVMAHIWQVPVEEIVAVTE